MVEILDKRSIFTRALYLIESNFKIELITSIENRSRVILVRVR